MSGIDDEATGPVPGARGATSTAPDPRPWWRRRLASLIFVAVVAVIVGGALALSLLNASRSPEALAQRYLDALAAGDAAQASALVDPGIPDELRTHLTDAVLQAATARLTDARIGEVTGTDDRRTIEIRYTIDGMTTKTQLEVERGAPQWFVLDTWRITTPLLDTVHLEADVRGEVVLGGVPVALVGAESAAAEIMLYPGVYEITPVEDGLLTLDPTTVQAGGWENGARAHLEFSPTQRLVDAVQERVDELIDACAASTAARDEDCPLRAIIYPVDTPVTWSVERYPAVEVSAPGTAFEARGGAATARYIDPLAEGAGETAQRIEIRVYGSIRIDGDTVTVVFEN